jgi:hypothetical protein
MSRGLRDGGFCFQHAPTRQPISSKTVAGVLVHRPDNSELSVPGVEKAGFSSGATFSGAVLDYSAATLNVT